MSSHKTITTCKTPKVVPIRPVRADCSQQNDHDDSIIKTKMQEHRERTTYVNEQ